MIEKSSISITQTERSLSPVQETFSEKMQQAAGSHHPGWARDLLLLQRQMSRSRAAPCVAIFLLAGALAGCMNRAVESNLQPSFVADVSPPPIVSAAVRVEPDQVHFLVERGAKLLGVVRLAPSKEPLAWADFGDFHRAAPAAVAKAGGTHFAFVASGSGVPVKVPFAAYIVWRLEPERWRDLPPELQPPAG
jgi:hypothetical protein